MNIREYRDKVMGCWIGKNIGGSLGTPFEGIRGVFDVEYYVHDISKGALANDDLDLQLVWLNAAEKYGRNLDAEILGEYWLSYIVADVSEYGMGKNNIAMGLLPPISGWYNNKFRNSCGCFIRSELWACLAPGHPEIAVKYAYEDAIVDHSEEGVYAEIFCAALQSAAFSESDAYLLIKTGLSFIPADCAIAIAVKTAVESYNNGLSWKEARKKILQTVPGSFGRVPDGQEPEPDVPRGETGYNAPSNIGLMVTGWLYGEGDFSKGICIAANCGEDTDCTAATIGALMGIIGGTASIPKKWIDPIGDEIKTICVDLTKREKLRIPETIVEFTERICTLMPVFMGEHCNIMGENGVVLNMQKGDALMDSGVFKGRVGNRTDINFMFVEKLREQPFGVRRKSVPFDVTLDYMGGIAVRDGEEKEIVLHIENNLVEQQWITVTWHVPADWSVLPGKETVINLHQLHGVTSLTDAGYTIIPHGVNKGKYDLILEIKSHGRLGTMYVPVLFISGPGAI